MPEVYFHLGLEKTGSTFLQSRVFNRLDGIKYHRKSRFKYLDKIISEDPNSKHFFSFETDRELFNIADEVSRKLPDARVFLILRRADSWLSSKYNYHIRKHGRLSMSEFFDLDSDSGFWKQEEFYLKPKIEYLERAFKKQVLFLNYHELQSNPTQYVSRITNFLQCELRAGANLSKASKPAFSLKQNRILLAFNRAYPYAHLGSSSRFLNRLWYKYREFLLHIVAFLAQFVPGFLVSKEPLIDQRFLDRVKAHYAEDWKFAEGKTNVSVQK